MSTRKNLRRILFVLPMAFLGLVATHPSQRSQAHSAQAKAKTSAPAARQGNWSDVKTKAYTVEAVTAEGESITLSFGRAKLKKFQTAVKANDKKQITEYLDFVLDEFERAGVQCPEVRKKISSCVWLCGDGTKVDTCKDRVMTDVVSRIWPGQMSG